MSPVPVQTQEFVQSTLDTMDQAERYADWLLARATPHLGDRVLDWGAGGGTFTTRLLSLGKQVVAVEPDATLATALGARTGPNPRLQVVHGEAADVTETSGFDSAICLNVLEHIYDDAGALSDVRSLLRPTGRLLLLVPAHPGLFGATDVALGHERRYAKSGLRAQLERNGFDVVTLRHVNPVGALGWLMSSRVLRRREIDDGLLAIYDRFVPLFRAADRLKLPFGLSLWAVAQPTAGQP